MPITPGAGERPPSPPGRVRRPAPRAVDQAGASPPTPPAYNMTGQPAIAVPAGIDADGLPLQRPARRPPRGRGRALFARRPARAGGAVVKRRPPRSPGRDLSQTRTYGPRREQKGHDIAGARRARPAGAMAALAASTASVGAKTVWLRNPAEYRTRVRRACRRRCTRRPCSRTHDPSDGVENPKLIASTSTRRSRPEDGRCQPPHRPRGALDRALPGGALLAVLPRVRAHVPAGHADCAGGRQRGDPGAAQAPPQRRRRPSRPIWPSTTTGAGSCSSVTPRARSSSAGDRQGRRPQAAVRARMLSAILMGGNVLVKRG